MKEEMKRSTKQRWKLFGVFAGMLALIGALFLWLIFSNFKTNYKEIRTQYYELVTNQVIGRIEDTLRYGKKLTSYYGMDSILKELSDNLPQELTSYIVDATGAVRYSEAGAAAVPAEVASALKDGLMAEAAQEGLVYRELQNSNLFLWQIQEASGEMAGGVAHVQDTAALNAFFARQWREMLVNTLYIFLVCLVLMLLTTLLLPNKVGRNSGMHVGMRTCAVLVVLAVMCAGFMGYQQIQREYKSTMQTCGEGIASYIGASIKNVHDKGVAYEEMTGLSQYMSGNIKNTSLLWNLSLLMEVAGTDKLLMRESQTTAFIPIESDGERTGYLLRFELSSEYMNQMLTQLFLTFALTVLAMFLICGEVNRLPRLWIAEEDADVDSAAVADGRRETQLRMVSFLLYMANYIALPYSAAVIREHGAGLFGLSVASTASLPLTFEIGAMLIGLLIFPKLFRRRKNSVLAFAGILLLAVGNLAALFAPDALLLIAYRMICGLGLASIKLFLNRVSVLGSEAAVQSNVGAINIGVLGGITCGGSIGAIVAENLGTSFTFLCAAGLFLLVGALLLFMFKEDYGQTDASEGEKSVFFQLFKSPQTLLYLLAVILPLNLGLMFIVSFAPAFVAKTGASGLLTSYAFMVNGLAGIYVGSTLSRIAAKRFSTNISLMIMLLIGAAAVLALGSPIVLVAAVLLSSALFGLFDVYGNPVTAKGFLTLPPVKTLPPAAALTALGVLGSLIQLVAPTVYSLLLTDMDPAAPMAALWPVLAALLAAAVLVLLLTGCKDKTAKADADA